ncbi:MAG: peptidase C39 bacteriocin [Geobacteraceae bacterium]|nr:MAG: peptidase C39 bacteriocin [Geobacteraceae bacterium]
MDTTDVFFRSAMNDRFFRHIALVIAFALAAPLTVSAGEIALSLGGRIHKPVRSLQEIRQARVAQQRWDYSCGSGALSTLLTYYYGDKVSESAIIASILHRTDPQKVRARGGFSLLDLKRFVESKGYEAKGYAGLTLEELVAMRTPAIVPVRIKGYDHFVIFRGLRGNRVVLADPSFGTTTMKPGQFQEIWKNGIGFIVLRQNSTPPSENMSPKAEDFCLPDGTAITRSLLRISTTPLTRNGL